MRARARTDTHRHTHRTPPSFERPRYAQREIAFCRGSPFCMCSLPFFLSSRVSFVFPYHSTHSIESTFVAEWRSTRYTRCLSQVVGSFSNVESLGCNNVNGTTNNEGAPTEKASVSLSAIHLSVCLSLSLSPPPLSLSLSRRRREL